MKFRNACFLSYRHRPDKGYGICIDDLYETLAGELSLLLTSQGLFRDVKRVRGGDFLDPSMAFELCGSACMVMVYIPPYFDEVETYCAREFRAMEGLELKRLKQLTGQSPRHGLIIPIVCRGWDLFPEKMRKARAAYNFEQYLLQKDRISKHREGKIEVINIARYIFDRVRDLEKKAPDACKDCEGFALPRSEEVVPWVREVQEDHEAQVAVNLLPGRTE
jgi:hypothetical protein